MTGSMTFTVTGTLQRDAWLQRVLPPVEQVRPGLWSVPVPIPNSPLRYVLCYVLEHRTGVVLVDPGWPADESYDALVAGLAECGQTVADVTGVLVTHAHHDHYGLACRVRSESGAWVALNRHDAELLTLVDDDHAEVLRERQEWLRRCGAGDDEVFEFDGGAEGVKAWAMEAGPDRDLTDGERIRVGRFDVEAVWTPGHSPGHMTFREHTDALLLSGDHLLPRITPNISAFVGHDESMLDDYLASLAKVAVLPVVEVLPAHEYRFGGVAARAHAIVAHHEVRLREIVDATSPREPRSAWQISRELTWSRSWDALGPFHRRAAVGETLAHLYCLQRRGDVTRTDDGTAWWWLRSGG